MEKLKLTGQRNQYPTCHEYFNSNAAFDKHRTGEFGRDRRCSTLAEMQSRGMVKAATGFWITAANPFFDKRRAAEES